MTLPVMVWWQDCVLWCSDVTGWIYTRMASTDRKEPQRVGSGIPYSDLRCHVFVSRVVPR